MEHFTASQTLANAFDPLPAIQVRSGFSIKPMRPKILEVPMAPRGGRDQRAGVIL
jgi:hypothetical protein